MEPRLGRLVGDLDLGAEASELIECSTLGRARVHAGDHAHLSTTKQEVLDLRTDQPKSREPNESTHEIDSVGALDLATDSFADMEVVAAVDQQRAGDSGRCPGLVDVPPYGESRPSSLDQELGRGVDRSSNRWPRVDFAVLIQSKQSIGELDLSLGTLRSMPAAAIDHETELVV